MEKMPQCMSTKDAKYGSWVAKYANCIFAKIESSFAAKGREISSCQFSSNDVCFPMLSRNVRISALTLSFHTFSEIFLRRQRSQFLPHGFVLSEVSTKLQTSRFKVWLHIGLMLAGDAFIRHRRRAHVFSHIFSTPFSHPKYSTRHFFLTRPFGIFFHCYSNRDWMDERTEANPFELTYECRREQRITPL